MSQDSEKYLYFTIGLLKGSQALEALRQDAIKYHMIDDPDKLIALRLTEYYELISRGLLAPSQSQATSAPVSPVSQVSSSGTIAYQPPVQQPVAATSNGSQEQNSSSNGFNKVPEPLPGSDQKSITAQVSDDADQNAEEAADYWTLL